MLIIPQEKGRIQLAPLVKLVDPTTKIAEMNSAQDRTLLWFNPLLALPQILLPESLPREDSSGAIVS